MENEYCDWKSAEPIAFLPKEFYFMTVSTPPEGWADPKWATDQSPPTVGREYVLRCVAVKTEEDGRITATMALCPTSP